MEGLDITKRKFKLTEEKEHFKKMVAIIFYYQENKSLCFFYNKWFERINYKNTILKNRFCLFSKNFLAILEFQKKLHFLILHFILKEIKINITVSTLY